MDNKEHVDRSEKIYLLMFALVAVALAAALALRWLHHG